MSDKNPIALIIALSLIGVGVGALSTRLLLSERTNGPIYALYERVDAVIILLWVIIALVLGGSIYAAI